MSANWIQIKPNQKVTYIVNGTLPYHIQMGQNSQVIVKSKHPNQEVVINGSVWGPGNFTLDCNATVKGNFGSAPASNVLTPQAVSYTQMDITVAI